MGCFCQVELLLRPQRSHIIDKLLEALIFLKRNCSYT